MNSMHCIICVCLSLFFCVRCWSVVMEGAESEIMFAIGDKSYLQSTYVLPSFPLSQAGLPVVSEYGIGANEHSWYLAPELNDECSGPGDDSSWSSCTQNTEKSSSGVWSGSHPSSTNSPVVSEYLLSSLRQHSLFLAEVTTSSESTESKYVSAENVSVANQSNTNPSELICEQHPIATNQALEPTFKHRQGDWLCDATVYQTISGEQINRWEIVSEAPYIGTRG